MGTGVRGIDGYDFLVFRDGLVQQALVMEGEAEVVMGRDIIGGEFDGRTVVTDGPFEVSFGL